MDKTKQTRKLMTNLNEAFEGFNGVVSLGAINSPIKEQYDDTAAPASEFLNDSKNKYSLTISIYDIYDESSDDVEVIGNKILDSIEHKYGFKGGIDDIRTSK